MKCRMFLAFALVLLSSLLSPLSLAGKVVLFNPEAAIVATDAYKKTAEDFGKKKEVIEMVAESERLKADLIRMGKEKDTKGLTWSVEQKNEHVQKENFINEDFQLLRKKFQTSQAAMQKTFMEGIEPKIGDVLKEIMAEDSIDIVLDARTAVIALPEADITRKVTEKLNKLK